MKDSTRKLIRATKNFNRDRKKMGIARENLASGIKSMKKKYGSVEIRRRTMFYVNR